VTSPVTAYRGTATPAIAFHRDLANVARLYRLSLSARALENDLRHRHQMAADLVAAADAAGEIAQRHSETAMYLAAIGEARP
jgi:hypothetical protein